MSTYAGSVCRLFLTLDTSSCCSLMHICDVEGKQSFPMTLFDLSNCNIAKLALLHLSSCHVECCTHNCVALRCSICTSAAVPEIHIRSLSPEDEFIVLACDGLWDVYTSQRVIELARQNLQQNNNDPQICAEYLVRAWIYTLLCLLVSCGLSHSIPVLPA